MSLTAQGNSCLPDEIKKKNQKKQTPNLYTEHTCINTYTPAKK